MTDFFWANAAQCFSILFCAGLVFAFLPKRQAMAPAAGAAVMAAGIFGLASLPQLISRSAPMMRLFKAELLIIWGALAVSYLWTCFRGDLKRFTQEPLARFGVGTWVAATSLLVQSMQKFPFDRYPLAWFFALLAFAIWLWFLKLAVRGMRFIATDPSRWEVAGAVLLATVSTQSIVLMCFSLFANQVPDWIYLLLIGAGYLFYGAGMLLIVRRYAKQKSIRLSTDWSDSNCIMHGALSISGLAGAVTGVSPHLLVSGTWIAAASLFLFVEGIEIFRMIERIRGMGWRQGIWVYDAAQWARNFTFGMFYAFTLEMRRRHIGFNSARNFDAGALIERFIKIGPYIVLTFLLLETTLCLSSELNLRAVARAFISPLKAQKE